MSEKRNIVITGVSRGLGLAMAHGFAQLGHTVIGCARSANALASLTKELGQPHRFDVVDVSNEHQVADWAAAVIESHATPDLIVNNAALINENASLWNVPADEFSRVIDVNIKGTFHVVRSFLPAMIDAGKGVIANFSSGWGRSTAAEVAPYCATKFAVEGMTQSLAQELPGGLVAVPVNPGVINTDMLQSCFGGDASSFPSAEDWATRAVPFLLELGTKDNGRPVSI